MKYGHVLLVLGILVAVVGAFPPGSCDGYTNISQAWRNANFFISPYFEANPYDDSFMVSNWWRFVGPGGDILLTLCKTGGTGNVYSIAIDAPFMPTTEKDTATPVTANAFGPSCFPNTFYIDVVLCPGNFYIYNPRSHPASSGYSTWHRVCQPDSCGPNAECFYFSGYGMCRCLSGYNMEQNVYPPEDVLCIDVDECLYADVCGPLANCTNGDGTYNCTCFPGYAPPYPTQIASPNNPCSDIDECTNTSICTAYSDCINTDGNYTCECYTGFYSDPPVCKDIDECSDTTICGYNATCNNTLGSYTCECDVGYRVTNSLYEPSPTNLCLDIDECWETPAICGRNGKCTNTDGSFMCTCYPGYRLDPALMGVSDPCVELNGMMFNPGDYKPKSFTLGAGQITMAINIEDLAKNNNDYGAVAIMKLNGLDSLLSHQYFETENTTEFAADVFSAYLPYMNNTNITDPINFTIPHSKMFPNDSLPTCTYWVIEKAAEEESEAAGGDTEDGEELSGFTGYWSTEGCWVSYTHENFTICSCLHLSTFALIMQMGEPPPESDFLNWLNRICVGIGLFFFALAILTFLLCSWNPKINNTARLHLCLNLGLSHLLLLFNENFYADELACKAIAGILHFLVVASFVWMLLEAVQLYMLVHRLNKVQVIERDGLPKLVLFLIGYGVPLLIVGVSALVYHPGYGATAGNVCWLSTTRNFNWALTGPVVTILILNLMLFCATLWSLRTTLASMRSGASNSKDTRLVLFKIVAQFVILGCTWILGLYQSNLFFQILFIVLNSQQGTFLYIVHCVLNKEIREECLKCLTCSHSKEKDKDKTVSTTYDIDK
ncbi:adhesion G protein-coupled receptor E1-like [Boleophthalmus pectinirostris]|uniref:adhesion G protein-coupled receptor E1-like n=1 Tax=Boleophthalmus pectinirostris TaxID=150288 RepID=UPI00242E72AB|nr:adhesion G protein-coupled receptor E1-like [Boleophthalmus pectinirostris]